MMITPHRIVSLIASATEIVCALGFEDQLVGRSHECDFPASIRHLPACSAPRIDVHGGSREIDEQVRNNLKEALSIYRIFTDELQRLQPTHLITQSQCEVCAVSLKDVEQALCGFIGSQPQIIAHEPMHLNDLWNDIQKTASSLGAPERGRELTAALQRRLQHLQASSTENCKKPRVLCLEWLDPAMSAGNWVPELVEFAGGIPLLSVPGRHSPYLTWEQVAIANPDVIAVMPCGFDIARTVSEIHVLQSQPAWSGMTAVMSGRVYITDGNQYFNRPGPRLVESAEILAEIFRDQPGISSIDNTRHHGAGWIRLDEMTEVLCQR